MSRIGKKPIAVPSGVKVEVSGANVKISGSKATLELTVNPEISVAFDDGKKEIVVSRKSDDRFQRAMHGTTRAHLANMVKGVTEGFSRSLQIYGTGYGVKEQGKELHISVGFAKPAVIPVPDGVKVDIKTPNARGNDVPAEFTVSGPDKYTVGQFAAEIRRIRKPEPYKGKGIRYSDEFIKRKVGKAFGTAG